MGSGARLVPVLWSRRPPTDTARACEVRSRSLLRPVRTSQIAGVAADTQAVTTCSSHLLLAEDNVRLRSAMRLFLEGEGYVVAEAGTGEQALQRLSEMTCDVALLDVMLPGFSGIEVCRRLRRTSDTPVIMVTARGDTDDVVAGLEAGADDYVTKPFDPKELLARIRAAQRRVLGAVRSTPLVFDGLEVIPEAGEVRRGGELIGLTKTEFRLLCELAINAGRVMSRESLMSSVWCYDYFGDMRVVDVHVRRLRTKLEVDPSRPRWVTTVRGLGYKLQP